MTSKVQMRQHSQSNTKGVAKMVIQVFSGELGEHAWIQNIIWSSDINNSKINNSNLADRQEQKHTKNTKRITPTTHDALHDDDAFDSNSLLH